MFKFSDDAVLSIDNNPNGFLIHLRLPFHTDNAEFLLGQQVEVKGRRYNVLDADVGAKGDMVSVVASLHRVHAFEDKVDAAVDRIGVQLAQRQGLDGNTHRAIKEALRLFGKELVVLVVETLDDVQGPHRPMAMSRGRGLLRKQMAINEGVDVIGEKL